jgi:hypothetical protein
VGAKGRRGGICMMWSNALKIEVVEYNAQIIAIRILEDFGCWILVGFYGPPYHLKRKKAWENLCALLESFEESWMCIGDFNVILDDEEKEGGNKGNSSCPNYLKEILFQMGAVDLGFTGNKFTWTNRRWGRNCIKERLDRGISSINWRIQFQKAVKYHLGAINSDHCPLLLDTNPADKYTPRPFRFEAAWTG